MTVRLYLFDDAQACRWQPFTLTRPACELVLGALPLWKRAASVWGVEYGGHLAPPHLTGFREDGGPSAVASPAGSGEHRVLVSSRAVVLRATELPPVAADLCIDGERVGWSLPPGTPLPPRGALADPATATHGETRVELEGFVLTELWELVERNPAQLREDLVGGTVTAAASPGVGARPRSAGASRVRPALPSGVHLLGDGLFSVGAGATLEPGVVLDTEPGPIVLADGVRVCSPARLEGPLIVARNSIILGGRVSASHIGPMCRVRGEVVGCVLLGYDNKAHGGYLGRAYLGRWVNLGALTTNSDLRNDYRDVRVHTGEGGVSSGLTKLGCFVGDHVKTAIGTLLDTGAVIGAGCNLFGGTTPARSLPPFRWGPGPEAPVYRLNRFLDTTARVMARRGVELTPDMRGVLERAWLSVSGTS